MIIRRLPRGESYEAAFKPLTILVFVFLALLAGTVWWAHSQAIERNRVALESR